MPSISRCPKVQDVSVMERLLTGGLHHLFADLEQYSYPDVVLGHHPVQHSLGALGVSHGQLVELHCVLLHCAEPGGNPEERN